ncbi:MAG: L,D-transpeptidase family protein [Candidatus Pacebacteria bacterium]|nr:L,D-transpeptidase family protein [Candidatus Paceibacterota bacterium]
MKKILISRAGILTWQGREYQCSLGAGGIIKHKMEGDRATPAGCFPLRYIWHRADRIPKIETELPLKALGPNNAWCDDPNDSSYNQPVELPYRASTEHLWRDDNIYDVIVVLGYNDNPVIPGKGSAIFMHVARKNYSPTDGCVALALDDLLEILGAVKKEDVICIKSDE